MEIFHDFPAREDPNDSRPSAKSIASGNQPWQVGKSHMKSPATPWAYHISGCPNPLYIYTAWLIIGFPWSFPSQSMTIHLINNLSRIPVSWFSLTAQLKSPFQVRSNFGGETDRSPSSHPCLVDGLCWSSGTASCSSSADVMALALILIQGWKPGEPSCESRRKKQHHHFGPGDSQVWWVFFQMATKNRVDDVDLQAHSG